MSEKTGHEAGLEVQPLPRSKPRRWFRFLTGSVVPPVPEQRDITPQAGASIVSNLTWTWLNPLLRTGYLRIIEANDIGYVEPKNANQVSSKVFTDHYEKLKAKEGAKGIYIKTKEFRALIRAIQYKFAVQLLVTTLALVFLLVTPFVSRAFIDYISELYAGEPVNNGRGVGLGITNSAMALMFSYCFIGFDYLAKKLSESIRCVLTTAVYRKALRLSASSRSRFPASKITTLITLDVNRVQMAGGRISMVILFPLSVAAATGALVYNVGAIALVGVGFIFLGIFMNGYLAKVISSQRGKSIPFADKRVSLLRATVENIRIVKLYGWEDSFLKLIQDNRNKEAHWLKLLGFTINLAESVFTSIPIMAGALTFVVREVTNKGLNPAYIFPSLSLFELFVPLTAFFAMGLAYGADAYKSLKRLGEFFAAEEDLHYVEQKDLGDVAVKITNGTFIWDVTEEAQDYDMKTNGRTGPENGEELKRVVTASTTAEGMGEFSSPFVGTISRAIDVQSIHEHPDPSSPHASERRAGSQKFPGLLNINLDIKKGEFILVMGSIGSGKTSLLSAIAGEIKKTSGSVQVSGPLSQCLVSWSQNATIRENILFGLPFDPVRYNEVVKICCLQEDFDNFRDGDFSEVGERGITLSGGQKARLSLARSVYANGEIFLLDDVLSAVDPRVGARIRDQCILWYLRDKTRILATHQLSLVKSADRIIYMDGWGGFEIDTADNLLKTSTGFAALISLHSDQGSDEEDESIAAEEDNDNAVSEIPRKMTEKLTTTEEKSTGQVRGIVLGTYIKAGSGRLGYGVLAVIGISLALQAGSSTL